MATITWTDTTPGVTGGWVNFTPVTLDADGVEVHGTTHRADVDADGAMSTTLSPGAHIVSHIDGGPFLVQVTVSADLDDLDRYQTFADLRIASAAAAATAAQSTADGAATIVGVSATVSGRILVADTSTPDGLAAGDLVVVLP